MSDPSEQVAEVRYAEWSTPGPAPFLDFWGAYRQANTHMRVWLAAILFLTIVAVFVAPGSGMFGVCWLIVFSMPLGGAWFPRGLMPQAHGCRSEDVSQPSYPATVWLTRGMAFLGRDLGWVGINGDRLWFQGRETSFDLSIGSIAIDEDSNERVITVGAENRYGEDCSIALVPSGLRLHVRLFRSTVDTPGQDCRRAFKSAFQQWSKSDADNSGCEQILPPRSPHPFAPTFQRFRGLLALFYAALVGCKYLPAFVGMLFSHEPSLTGWFHWLVAAMTFLLFAMVAYAIWFCNRMFSEASCQTKEINEHLTAGSLA